MKTSFVSSNSLFCLYQFLFCWWENGVMVSNGSFLIKWLLFEAKYISYNSSFYQVLFLNLLFKKIMPLDCYPRPWNGYCIFKRIHTPLVIKYCVWSGLLWRRVWLNLLYNWPFGGQNKIDILSFVLFDVSCLLLSCFNFMKTLWVFHLRDSQIVKLKVKDTGHSLCNYKINHFQ